MIDKLKTENIFEFNLAFEDNIYVLKSKKKFSAVFYKFIGKVLSKKQMQILSLLMEGHDDNKISKILSISKRTVQTHKSKLFDKFRVNSTLKLVAYCYKEIIIEKRYEKFLGYQQNSKKDSEQIRFLRVLKKIIDNYISANGKHTLFCQWLLEQTKAEIEG